MGKSKKHKSKHSSNDMQSVSPLPSNHPQRQDALVDESQLKKTISPSSPSVTKHVHHNRMSGLQLISPPDAHRTPTSANGKYDKMQEINSRQHSMFPQGFTHRMSGTYRNTAPYREQNESSNASRQPKHPTMITPPVDPRDTQSFRERVMAQNRQRNTQHQTFTATMPDESDSEALGAPSRIKERSDSDKKSGSKRRRTKRESKSESEQETDTSTEGSTDTETSNESTAEQDLMDVDTGGLGSDNEKHMHKHKGRRSDRGTSHAPRATLGQESTETMRHSNKASMEQAAERAIYTLTKPVKSEQKNNRIPASTLNKPDRVALQSLQSLIPPHIQQHVRDILESQTPENNNTRRYHQEVSDIQHSLTAARVLILQLSAMKLNGRNNTASSASTESSTTATSNSLLQAEVLRILRDRDQTIQSLEMEVQDLKEQLHLMSEDN